MTLDELLRARPVAARWKRVLLERLDTLAVIYRLASAVSNIAHPIRLRWYRAMPMDAAMPPLRFPTTRSRHSPPCGRADPGSRRHLRADSQGPSARSARRRGPPVHPCPSHRLPRLRLRLHADGGAGIGTPGNPPLWGHGLRSGALGLGCGLVGRRKSGPARTRGTEPGAPAPSDSSPAPPRLVGLARNGCPAPQSRS